MVKPLPTTIQVSDEAHLELKKIKGVLLARDGRERSFDDVVKELIKCWKEHAG